MKTSNDTIKANIDTIENFAEYLKINYNDHKEKITQNANDADDYINSITFLKDYAEVSAKLVKIIKDYCEKTGHELKDFQLEENK